MERSPGGVSQDHHNYGHITVERVEQILIARIDRADSPLNPVNAQLHSDLGALFRHLKTESEARAVILTGVGSAFSAGGDFDWFGELRTVEAAHHLRREAKQIIWDLLDVEIPILCALNGPAVGLGASIALLCDMVVMSDAAFIADPHVTVGLVAGDGGAAIWPLLMGPLAAKRHLMLGDPLTAEQAHTLGIATEVCAASDLPERAMQWARRLAGGAPLAVQGTKAAVNQQIKQALITSFDLSTALEIPCLLSADHVEAVDAFRARRTPTFHAR
jgi:enoyl-CoA hydratase